MAIRGRTLAAPTYELVRRVPAATELVSEQGVPSDIAVAMEFIDFIRLVEAA
jgi:hypothetical protein